MSSLEFILRTFSEEDKPKREKEEVSLSGILQRQRLKLKKKKQPYESSLFFNPYSLAYGFCMREKVAQLAGLTKIFIKPPTPKEELVFDVGKHYHLILQRYFWKCGILEGEWKCKGCYHQWWDRSPKICPICLRNDLLEYREVPLKDETTRGRADGIIWVDVENKEEQQLIDIKSINNKTLHNMNQPHAWVCFEDLDTEGPVKHHVIQLMDYMRLSGIQSGHLLYVAKNDQRLKSFYIKYNESELAPYRESISNALVWAKDIKAGKRNDLPEPCSSKKCECEKIVYTPLKSQKEL